MLSRRGLWECLIFGPAGKGWKGLNGELVIRLGDPIHGILKACSMLGEFKLPMDLVLDRRIVLNISGVTRPV